MAAPKPEVGSRWRHPVMRHTWKVEKVGTKYVTLRADFPAADPVQVPVKSWPEGLTGLGWKRA